MPGGIREQEPTTAMMPFHAASLADGHGTAERLEVRSWLEELRRLIVEAEERLDRDCVLSALSSLAAIPSLHRMLIERCSELLSNAECGETAPDFRTGLYL
jgi:hypothetical protein